MGVFWNVPLCRGATARAARLALPRWRDADLARLASIRSRTAARTKAGEILAHAKTHLLQFAAPASDAHHVGVDHPRIGAREGLRDLARRGAQGLGRCDERAGYPDLVEESNFRLIIERGLEPAAFAMLAPFADREPLVPVDFPRDGKRGAGNEIPGTVAKGGVIAVLELRPKPMDLETGSVVCETFGLSLAITFDVAKTGRPGKREKIEVEITDSGAVALMRDLLTRILGAGRCAAEQQCRSHKGAERVKNAPLRHGAPDLAVRDAPSCTQAH